MKLIDLPNGLQSLEFAIADLDELRATVIELYGPYESEPWIDGSRVTIAGEKLLYVNDWDEPCMISKSPHGNDILRMLLAALEGRAAGPRDTRMSPEPALAAR